MSLNEAVLGREYKVSEINTDDAELKDFLLTLGCFEGEAITVVSEKQRSVVVAIKDGRYCLDRELASVVLI